MRCQEEALENHAVVSQGCSQLITHPRCSKTIGAQLYQITFTSNIATGKSHTAPRILYQGTSHNICSCLYRLLSIYKLTITVIHKADTIRLNLFNLLTNGPYFLNSQRVAHGVATGALNQHHLGIRSDFASNTCHIHLAINHFQLIIKHAKFL